MVTPKGRRGHTAVVHGECMYVYGGYQDLRGSSPELWALHLPSLTWHLVSQVELQTNLREVEVVQLRSLLLVESGYYRFHI